jgi:hypothetical protein
VKPHRDYHPFAIDPYISKTVSILIMMQGDDSANNTSSINDNNQQQQQQQSSFANLNPTPSGGVTEFTPQQKAEMIADEDPLLISQSLTYVTDDGSILHSFQSSPFSTG